MNELRTSKGTMRASLLNEYERLKKPCQNRSIHTLVKEVEEELSASVDFVVETTHDRAGGKETYLKTGQTCIKLPEDTWQPQVHKEAKTGIPYISNGRAAFRCISFFQEQKGGEESQQERNTTLPALAAGASDNFKLVLAFRSLKCTFRILTWNHGFMNSSHPDDW